MTRTEALEAGLRTYFTGKPCPKGHISERYVNNWTCVTCAKAEMVRLTEYRANWMAQHKERLAFLGKRDRETNPEHHKAKNKAWREANPDKCLNHSRKWHSLNREKSNQLSAEWRKRNPGIMNALRMKRHTDTLNRTPSWLTSDDHWMIKEAYRLAKLRSKMTGFDWQVDHVIPLRGRTVSGLHTPLNLQVIPWIDNLRKGNR